MARFFEDAHERFDENLKIISDLREKTPQDNGTLMLMWNLSVGLRNLTEALKAEAAQVQQTLAEIRRDLQRRG
jgi:hypothetical protein